MRNTRDDPRGRYRPVPLRDRATFRFWRAWARHTILLFVDGSPEEPEEAWRRRWHDLPERTKNEFRHQAENRGAAGTAQVD